MLNIKLDLPKLPIEDQLEEFSGTGKIGMFYFTPEGEMVSFWRGLSYMEKLFVIDSLQKRLEHDERMMTLDGEDD